MTCRHCWFADYKNKKHAMRIIGGKYKHKRFDVPRSFKARPTTDFAKENLFNILSNVYFDFDDAPTALDLFAGTGSIGLEFLSRGCGKVISVEKDFQHYRFLTEVSKQMNDATWKPVLADVFKYVERIQEKFDIIFADPPYTLEKLGDIPDIILGKDILNEGGVFILEHGKQHKFDNNPYLIDHRVYGAVNFSFFQKPAEKA